jgi:hypothetical protein
MEVRIVKNAYSPKMILIDESILHYKTVTNAFAVRLGGRTFC